MADENPQIPQPDQEPAEPDSTGRRGFVSAFLAGSISVWVGSALYTAGRFLSPPPSDETRLPKSIELDRSAREIAPGSGFVFPYGNKPAIIIRKKSGKLSAFFATCPHLGCTVAYDAQNERIFCACHEGVFDLDGKNIEGPPSRPLDKLRVKVDKDKVRVSLTGDKKA